LKEFSSFGSFAVHLVEREVVTVATLHMGLKRVAAAIEKTAKEEIGEYQPEVPPFPAWAPLAESTIDNRVAQGYSPDEPLLRTGDLRDSISHQVEGLEAAIGSDSEIALYQELGTKTIPPRPFLGPAAIRNEQLTLKTVGAAAVHGITGDKSLESYHFIAGGADV